MPDPLSAYVQGRHLQFCVSFALPYPSSGMATGAVAAIVTDIPFPPTKLSLSPQRHAYSTFLDTPPPPKPVCICLGMVMFVPLLGLHQRITLHSLQAEECNASSAFFAIQFVISFAQLSSKSGLSPPSLEVCLHKIYPSANLPTHPMFVVPAPPPPLNTKGMTGIMTRAISPWERVVPSIHCPAQHGCPLQCPLLRPCHHPSPVAALCRGV